MKQSSKTAGAGKAAPAKKSSSPAKKSSNNNAGGDHAAKQDSDSQPGSMLEKFFKEQLQDIYYAEHHLLKALPKMVEASTTQELKKAFEEHLQQTEQQVNRLEQVFESMGEKAGGKKCEAIVGIVKEAESIISDTKEGTMTRDAALIIAAQKVEHYEIATYGGLVQLAITLGQHRAAGLLEDTLLEEEETDLLLTDIAEGFINMEAEEEALYTSRKGRQQNNPPQNTRSSSRNNPRRTQAMEA